MFTEIGLLAAHAQKHGKTVLLVDELSILDPRLLKKHGVKLPELLVATPWQEKNPRAALLTVLRGAAKSKGLVVLFCLGGPRGQDAAAFDRIMAVADKHQTIMIDLTGAQFNWE